jgi:hypothetical protein
MTQKTRSRNPTKNNKRHAAEVRCIDDEEDEESPEQTGKRARACHSPSGLELETGNDSQGGDGVSSTQESSVQRNGMEEKWKRIEDRLRCMEERQGGISVVSGGGTITTPLENEMTLKENMRKFVISKVFPSWKFIFNKRLLETCVVVAVSKSHITMPPGFDKWQLAERCSEMVRSCLDGCRANAQSAARKR